MTELWEDLKSKVHGLLGSWASISALGSFVLYLFGYLALRFHLTTLGVGTDLAVLDERYLFTGAKFFIYLVCTIPILILIGLVLASPVILIAWLFRVVARRKNNNDVENQHPAESNRFVAFFREPRVLALLSLVISVVIVQFVMRQCYFFGNLLLASELPNTSLHLHKLLFDEEGGIRSLYFSGLVFGTLLTASLLYAAINSKATPAPKALRILAGLLVAIQFLLLPVNYGVFILEKQVPRVIDLGDQVPLAAGQEAWLVWEGNEGRTYLVRTNQTDRRLVTVPKKDFKKIEITKYDEIIKYLFDH